MDPVEPRRRDDQLAEPLAGLDHDLVPAIAAELLGIGDGNLELAEIEQHALVLQAVEPEDSVGAADMLAFDHRGLANVKAAAAEIEIVDRRGLNSPGAG